MKIFSIKSNPGLLRPDRIWDMFDRCTSNLSAI